MLEKYDKKGRKLYIVLAVLEKMFDCFIRQVIWRALRRKVVMERKVLAVKEMYFMVSDKEIKVKVGFHQDSILSSSLFAVAIDEVAK